MRTDLSPHQARRFASASSAAPTSNPITLDIMIFFTGPSGPFRNVALILFHFAPAGGWAASVTRRQVLSGLNAVMPATMWAVFGPRSFS